MKLHRLALVAVLAVALAAMMTVGACKKKGEEAPASASPAETATTPEETPEKPADAWVRPAPSPTPEDALRDLFAAMKTGDLREIEARLMTPKDCVALTGDASRCGAVKARVGNFLAVMKKQSLPAEAAIRGITLAKSADMTIGDRKLKLQLGSISFMLTDGLSNFGPVAAIQVEGGWRVLPDRPRRPAPKPKERVAPSKTAAPAPAPKVGHRVEIQPPGGSKLGR